ncbi:MAG: hypothetical protein CL953_06415 [Erythrobacteraceae bacterium]|nr:hypothetical protein [Erythrobacteraceae bacterium]
MPARCEKAPGLRAQLRAATQSDHQSLDDMLGSLDLADRHDYIRFLDVQLRARLGVEQWLFQHCPYEWLPPSQITLLRRDLEWLGHTVAEGSAPAFVAPAVSPSAWLGAAWVLAGSSLGNKMMERELAPRVAPSWPMAFVRDEAMPRYFKALRPLLESNQQDLPAEWAARAVFGHFNSICGERLAVHA